MQQQQKALERIHFWMAFRWFIAFSLGISALVRFPASAKRRQSIDLVPNTQMVFGRFETIVQRTIQIAHLATEVGITRCQGSHG
jgi:hypothetical protein